MTFFRFIVMNQFKNYDFTCPIKKPVRQQPGQQVDVSCKNDEELCGRLVFILERDIFENFGGDPVGSPKSTTEQ